MPIVFRDDDGFGSPIIGSYVFPRQGYLLKRVVRDAYTGLRWVCRARQRNIKRGQFPGENIFCVDTYDCCHGRCSSEKNNYVLHQKKKA